LWNAYTLPPPVESLAGVDAVIHLAGETVNQRWTPSAKRRIRDSRVIGTTRLIEAIGSLESKPSVLVCASATGIYGDRGEETLTETSPPGGGFLAEVCVEWEAAAAAAAAFGIRVACLRFAMVLGKEGGALAQMRLPFEWGLGARIATGSQWMSWIHADDAVSLILRALADDRVTGAINAAAPNPVTNTEFTAALAAVLRRPALFRVPEGVLRLIYGEMAEIVLASQRVEPKAAREAGFEFRHPQLRGALQNLLA
jgi:uncharacterized protein (TIGR01777 family)